MEESKQTATDALENREAEATTDETLSDLEEQQEVDDTADTQEGIPAPDSGLGQPPHRDDEDLM